MDNSTNEENKIVYKFNLVTSRSVEYNASKGKLSFELNNFCIPSKSTLKNLYEKASEVIHLSEEQIILWIVEKCGLIRRKIENTNEIEVDFLFQEGIQDVFIYPITPEIEGNFLFLIFSYSSNFHPSFRLIFTTILKEDSTLNDLHAEYCSHIHSNPESNFTLSYRINDYELKKIEKEKFELKIKDLPEITSLIVLQPDDLNNISISPLFFNSFIYVDNHPNSPEEFLNMTRSMKTVLLVKSQPMSKGFSSSNSQVNFIFPPSITYECFASYTSSLFSQNGVSKPCQCTLLFPDFHHKPLNFEFTQSAITMDEVFKKVNFETVYCYFFPFIHFSCMQNVSRLIFILTDQGCIYHFFNDNTQIYKVIEFSLQKQWIKSSEPYTLIYRKKKNGHIKKQIDPMSVASDVKNPIYFCLCGNDGTEFSPKDAFIPVEFFVNKEDGSWQIQRNFLVKVIAEETFDKTIDRIEIAHGNLPENCKFRIYNKNNGEVDLEPDSVLSYEKDIVLRIYASTN